MLKGLLQTEAIHTSSCHTRQHHVVGYVPTHHKMQALLSQKVICTAINCVSISEETLQAGCGIWEGVQQVTVLMHVNI